MKRRSVLLAILLTAVFAFAAFAAPDPAQPRFGGILKATINSNPASLDPMLEGGENELIPAAHIFETALTTGLEGGIFAGVCTYEVKNDGRVIELTLRDGVKFHDGSTVTIGDVKAATDRWLANVRFAKSHVGAKMESLETVGNKIIFTFKEPAPLALTAIATWDRGLYIIPKSVCEKYPDAKIENIDLIGTGPYTFKDYQVGRFVVLEKFKEYVSYDSGGTGLAAPKQGYVDTLYFYPVSDRTARITGVQTGEYDVAIAVPANMLEAMRKDPDLNVEIKELGIMPVAVFNFKQGPCSDVNLRNAILACLDMDELMMAAQGDESLYYLNPSVMQKSSRWWTNESLGKYNNVDLTKAMEYLKASSYDGRPLVFITTKANDYFYKTALLMQQMVKPIGIEIDLQVYDNPTLRQYRMQPDKFDIFSGGLTAKVDPTLIAFLEEGWAGFYSSEKKSHSFNIMTTESDFDTRYKAWVDLSKTLYEELPVISFGERNVAVVSRKHIHNLFDTTEKYYWNTWVGE
jgi:peptide/nickel transport system substrate-binding protein